MRLEDTDADGRMDTSEVFLEQLVNPRAVAVTNAGVLIAEPPNLWLCELSGRDAACREKRRLGDYGVAADGGNVEHLENKLLPGLDNWYYNSKSSRKLRLVDGKMQSRESLYRGQWGLARDNVGRLYYNHNSNLISADFFAAEDLFSEESTTPAPGLGVVLTAPEEVFSVRVNPGVNRAYLEGVLRPDGRLRQATSASGLVVYRGRQFPRQYRRNVFVAEPAANVVARFSIAENGLELRAEHHLYPDEKWGQREFLASTDERFRPVDLLNGPDGNLYIIDMYRGLIQDQQFLTEELREQVLQRQLEVPIGLGRIWRLRHAAGADDTASGGMADSELVGGLADAGAEHLVSLLRSENGWHRDTAQRLLLRIPGQGSAQLRSLVGGAHSLAAIHALWTLHGRGELERETVLAALALDDTRRQVQALWAGRAVLKMQDLLTLAETAQSAGEAVRMQLAFAMGDHAQDPQVQDHLLELLAADTDSQYVRQAVVHAVKGHESEFLSRVLAHGITATDTASAVGILRQLTASAWRSARSGLDREQAATPAMTALLAILEAQTGAREWAQIAMLQGLHGLARGSGFKPVVLAEAPPVFAQGSGDVSAALWDARLLGRRVFTWPGDELATGVEPLSKQQLALMERGAAIYTVCGACHGQDGAGIAGLGTALAASAWVEAAPEQLGRIILQGFDTEQAGIMPGHGHLEELDDHSLAGLMLYLRRSWGNNASPVSVEMAASIREAGGSRTRLWTVEELEAVAIARNYQRFAGSYRMSFLTVTIEEEFGVLHLKAPMYGGNTLIEEAEGVFTMAGDSSGPVRIEFQISTDGSVPSFTLYRQGQTMSAQRVQP